MSTKRVPIEEQYLLVMECRQSGLSDHQWCVEHDIKPGTFYNWVKRLRQKGYADIPNALGHHHSPKQDVVRLDNLCQEETIISDTDIIETNETSELKLQSTMELSIGNTDIRITNAVDPKLLAQTIQILKGLSC
jgi:transposase-like protein